jgi:hypothetical protein
MEEQRSEDEEAKDGDLSEQTGDDNLLSAIVRFDRPRGLNATAGRLQGKRDDVAANEKLRQPPDRYE